MDLITLDFETYYSKDYSLGKLTTEEYIRDPRFEVIGVGIKLNDKETEWASGTHKQLREYLQTNFPWADAMVLAHNTMFDGAILNWVFNISPRVYTDTLCISRGVHGVETSSSLKALVENYDIGAKGTEVFEAIGKRREDFTESELSAYGDYCVNDVDLTYKAFLHMAKDFPKSELKLIDLKKRLKIVKEQEDISQKLLEVEATNRLKHLEILRERQEVEGSIDEQQSIIDLSKNDLEKVQNNYIEELNIELSQYRKEKEELNKRIQKYSDSLNRTVLKSPVSGTVKLVSVNSKGAIVAPGVTVVEIVPENEKLIIEAKLPLSEIGYVKKNLEAKIRLNTPEGSRFRSIKGKVVFVGADRISSKDEEGFYLVKVETSENSFARKNEEYKLLSGVPVMVGIITGKRSFMDYFLTPFITGASFALSER